MSTQTDVQPEHAEAERYTAILERLNRRAESMTEAAIAFAPSRQYNDLTVIPVARVRSGFGGGFGAGKGNAQAQQQEGVGGGGALSVTPVGYIEVKEGMTTFRPIVIPGAILRMQIVGGLVALALAGLFAGRRAARRRERGRGIVLSMISRPGTGQRADRRHAKRWPWVLRAGALRQWGWKRESPSGLRQRLSSLLPGSLR